MGWYDNVQVQAPTGQGYAQAAQLMANSGQGIKDAIKEGSNFFANKAIGELMAKKPTGIVDPTAHIADVAGYLGFLHPEQAQAYKDYGQALQTSYGRNLEQERFGEQQKFNREQLAQAKTLAEMQNKTTRDVSMAQIGMEQKRLDQMAKQFEQTSGIELAKNKLALNLQGYDYDNKTKKIGLLDIHTPEGQKSAIGAIHSALDAADVEAQKAAKDIYSQRGFLGSMFKNDAAEAQDRAAKARATISPIINQLMSNPNTKMTDLLSILPEVKNYMITGQVSPDSAFGKSVELLGSKPNTPKTVPNFVHSK